MEILGTKMAFDFFKKVGVHSLFLILLSELVKGGAVFHGEFEDEIKTDFIIDDVSRYRGTLENEDSLLPQPSTSILQFPVRNFTKMATIRFSNKIPITTTPIPTPSETNNSSTTNEIKLPSAMKILTSYLKKSNVPSTSTPKSAPVMIENVTTAPDKRSLNILERFRNHTRFRKGPGYRFGIKSFARNHNNSSSGQSNSNSSQIKDIGGVQPSTTFEPLDLVSNEIPQEKAPEVKIINAVDDDISSKESSEERFKTDETRSAITADQLSGNRPTNRPFHFTTEPPLPPTTTPSPSPKNNVKSINRFRKPLVPSPHNHIYAPTTDPVSDVKLDKGSEEDLSVEEYQDIRVANLVFGSKVGSEISTPSPNANPAFKNLRERENTPRRKTFHNRVPTKILDDGLEDDDEGDNSPVDIHIPQHNPLNRPTVKIAKTPAPEVTTRSPQILQERTKSKGSSYPKKNLSKTKTRVEEEAKTDNLPFYKEPGGVFKEHKYSSQGDPDESNQISRNSYEKPRVKYAPTVPPTPSVLQLLPQQQYVPVNVHHMGHGQNILLQPVVPSPFFQGTLQSVNGFFPLQQQQGYINPLQVQTIAAAPVVRPEFNNYKPPRQRGQSIDVDFPEREDPDSDSYYGNPRPDTKKERQREDKPPQKPRYVPKKAPTPPKNSHSKGGGRKLDREGDYDDDRRPAIRNNRRNHDDDYDYDNRHDEDYGRGQNDHGEHGPNSDEDYIEPNDNHQRPPYNNQRDSGAPGPRQGFRPSPVDHGPVRPSLVDRSRNFDNPNPQYNNPREKFEDHYEQNERRHGPEFDPRGFGVGFGPSPRNVHLDPIYTRTIKQYDDEIKKPRPTGESRHEGNGEEPHENGNEGDEEGGDLRREEGRKDDEENDGNGSESPRSHGRDRPSEEEGREDGHEKEEGRGQEEDDDNQKPAQEQDEEEEEEEEAPQRRDLGNRQRNKKNADTNQKPPPKKPVPNEKSGDLEEDIQGIEKEFGGVFG